jgi:hypothetical protein
VPWEGGTVEKRSGRSGLFSCKRPLRGRAVSQRGRQSFSGNGEPAPTGPAPVEARFGNYLAGPRHRTGAPTCAESLLSQREEQGKDGGRRAWLVPKPGSHRYRTGGEPEGGG